MFLWIPGLQAWRSGVKLGFFPVAVLNTPARFIRSTQAGRTGGYWVDLPGLDAQFHFREIDEHKLSPVSRADLARQWGYRLKDEAPTGTWRTVAFLWNLFGVTRRSSAVETVRKNSLLIRFPSAERATPLIQEILRIENAIEVRFGREANHFWLQSNSLSRFTTLAIEQGEQGEQGEYAQATLFVEAAPHLWVEAGYAHPLEEALSFPPTSMTVIDGANQVSLLEEGAFEPLLAAAQWKIEPPRERPARSADEPFLEVPLKLALLPSSKEMGLPDLWVIGAHDLPLLGRWFDWADLEVRQAFRFAVLVQDSRDAGDTILVYRFREVLQSALGEIPGVPYRQSRQLSGLFVPFRTKLHPDPGPVYLRKLLGMDRLDKMAWIERLENGRLRPNLFASSALGGWETVVRFSLEKNQSAWRAWTQSFSFAWETIPEVKEAEQAPALPEKPAKNSPEDALKQERLVRSGPLSPERQAKPKKSGKEKAGPKSSQANESLFASEEKQEEAVKQNKPENPSNEDPKNRISRRLLDEFEASSLDWGAPERWGRLRELALAWQAEGQPIWAGKAWQIAAWNQGISPWDDSRGRSLLRAWHRAEAQLRGLPAEPGLRALAQQASSADFRLNRMGWLLTGLILILDPEHSEGSSKISEEEGQTRQHYRDLQKALIEHGRAGSQRLLFLAWAQLARIQSDRLIATRAFERQRFSLLETGLNLKEEWPGPLLGQRSGGQRSGSGEARNQLDALGLLLERTSAWLEHHGQNDRSCMTLALVRWSFAYGFARLGAAEKARDLALLASKKMAVGEIAPLLAQAYNFRLEQALMGKPASGPLPAEWLARVSQLEGLKAFPLDYTREMSHILEPHQSVQPFAGAIGAGPESWAVAVAAQGGDPGALGRLCLERAEVLRHGEPGKTNAGWLKLLDLILLLPSVEARAILDILFELQPLPDPQKSEEKASRKAPSIGTDFRLTVRALIACSFFQHRAEDCFRLLLPMFEDRELLAGWLGLVGAAGTIVPVKTLGMNKELFLFCSRRLGLLAQMDRKSWIGLILDSLSRGLDKLGRIPHAAHGRFLVDASRLRFLAEPSDGPVWQNLEEQLRAESGQLAGTSLRRNEPWQAHVNKLVAYIQAAGARGPEVALGKLTALFDWIVPLKDFFATNPALAARGSEANRAGILAYQRNQVEWIESMVLALAESADATVSEWARRDEALIRKRITQALDGNQAELLQAVHWERELSI